MILYEDLCGLPKELWMAAERAVPTRNDDMRNALVGCVIRRDDGVLVSSRNGSSRGQKNSSSHAEARCSRKADVNSVAYVARVRRDGSVGCARPCKACRVQMRSRGVTHVEFTLGPNSWGKMRLNDEAEQSWTNTRPV